MAEWTTIARPTNDNTNLGLNKPYSNKSVHNSCMGSLWLYWSNIAPYYYILLAGAGIRLSRRRAILLIWSPYYNFELNSLEKGFKLGRSCSRPMYSQVLSFWCATVDRGEPAEAALIKVSLPTPSKKRLPRNARYRKALMSRHTEPGDSNCFVFPRYGPNSIARPLVLASWQQWKSLWARGPVCLRENILSLGPVVQTFFFVSFQFRPAE